jgi:hypothetical protein
MPTLRRRRRQQTRKVESVDLVVAKSSNKRSRSSVEDEVTETRDNEVAELDNGPSERMAVTPSIEPTELRRQINDNASIQSLPRKLFNHQLIDSSAVLVTPTKDSTSSSNVKVLNIPTKRRLVFGRLVSETHIPANVKSVYRIIRTLTGSIGGNASMGPIYGELTMGSMQKMINLMKEHTHLDEHSYFIDVGSGIGKPNIHVAQDSRVKASYGIEVEQSRWVLGMSCLKGILDLASSQSRVENNMDKIGCHCLFENKDIRQAKSFDPFTHVYMFSIGYVFLIFCCCIVRPEI